MESQVDSSEENKHSKEDEYSEENEHSEESEESKYTYTSVSSDGSQILQKETMVKRMIQESKNKERHGRKTSGMSIGQLPNPVTSPYNQQIMHHVSIPPLTQFFP